jgi:hypothetical protein
MTMMMMMFLFFSQSFDHQQQQCGEETGAEEMAAAMKSPSPIAIPIKRYTMQIPLRILQLSICSLANNPSLCACMCVSLSHLPSFKLNRRSPICSFTGISVKCFLGGESVRHFAKYILKLEYSVANSLFFE